MRKLLLLFAMSLFASVPLAAQSQNQRVSGVVTGADGKPLAGVAVSVEGATMGTHTQMNGTYVLSAPTNGTLLFQFMGMTSQSVRIAERTTINVRMETATEVLDNVIVVAFGQAKREAFTGSAAVVNAADLEKRQTTNVVNALVGSVPGLQLRGGTGQPGSGPGVDDITIRGINSMYADLKPLIILDGAPFEANLSNIPQGDIESITVLKDAASAALYGARAANGVIIVTTKKGSSRNAVINVDMKWGVNTRAVPNYDVITDPAEYYEATYALRYNQEYYGLGRDKATSHANANASMLSSLVYDIYTRPSGEALIGLDGKINPNATLGRSYTAADGHTYWLSPDNWRDNTYKNSLRQEYSVSLSGGDNRFNYYSSLSYLNDGGIVDNSNFERMTARIRTDYRAKQWLKVGVNAAYTHYTQDQNANWGTSTGSSNLFYFASGIAPIYPIYVRELDANGNVVIKQNAYGKNTLDYGVVSMGGYPGLVRPFLASGNPLGENNYNKYVIGNNLLNATLSADFILTDWLTASIQSTANYQHSGTTWLGNPYFGTPSSTKGYVEKRSDGVLRTNNLQTLSYNDLFGQHSVSAMLGHEYYNTNRQYLMGRGQGVFSDEILELAGTALSHVNGTSNSTRYNSEGYFAKANYDFAGKYFADISFRRDASSRFAPENRWGSFWAIGGAWLLSKEDFMSSVKWVDMLKLRASVGQRGNDNIGDFLYLDRFSIVNSGDDMTMSPTPQMKGNRKITWETTTSYTLATEFSLWKGRLSGVVDLYYNHTRNMLFSISLPESTGYRNYYANIGSIGNKGVELSLRGSVIRTHNFEWVLTGNISNNTTKILSLPASKINPALGGFKEGSRWFKEGGSLYNDYRREFAGVNEQGESLFYMDTKDKDGNTIRRGGTTTEFNSATEYEHGTTLPKFQGGFGTQLTWKRLDLAITFDYQIGGKIYDSYYAMVATGYETATSAGMAIHKDWKKAWSPTNTNSNLPRWQYGDRYAGAASDRWLTSASYLNFQSFAIGYTLPAKLIKNVGKIRVYAAGENLAFWSARKGLDPRYSFEKNEVALPYSPACTISGGLQLTF